MFLLYDPDCGFCRVCVAVILRWDRASRLHPVALGSEEADALLHGIPQDERMASWHLALPGSGRSVHSGGAAFPPLFRLLPGGGPFAWFCERFPRICERGYRLAADHRSLLGRALPSAARRWADGVISGSRPDGR
jgi:predicted DCC family thiol-disulfide oxidoreductase YuxK